MKKLDECKTGLVVGIFTATLHLLWSVLVALGFGQVFLDFIYGIHFLNNPFTVNGFNIITAGLLVIVTFIVGNVFGWCFAVIWNKFLK